MPGTPLGRVAENVHRLRREQPFERREAPERLAPGARTARPPAAGTPPRPRARRRRPATAPRPALAIDSTRAKSSPASLMIGPKPVAMAPGGTRLIGRSRRTPLPSSTQRLNELRAAWASASCAVCEEDRDVERQRAARGQHLALDDHRIVVGAAGGGEDGLAGDQAGSRRSVPKTWAIMRRLSGSWMWVALGQSQPMALR